MDQLERQVGKFVFATKSPFFIVENKEFVAMMQMVRPGIKLPRRQAIGGRILNDVYDVEWHKVAELTKDKYVTLAVDGWSNLTNDPILGTTMDTYLITSIDTNVLLSNKFISLEFAMKQVTHTPEITSIESWNPLWTKPNRYVGPT